MVVGRISRCFSRRFNDYWKNLEIFLFFIVQFFISSKLYRVPYPQIFRATYRIYLMKNIFRIKLLTSCISETPLVTLEDSHSSSSNFLTHPPPNTFRLASILSSQRQFVPLNQQQRRRRRTVLIWRRCEGRQESSTCTERAVSHTSPRGRIHLLVSHSD